MQPYKCTIVHPPDTCDIIYQTALVALTSITIASMHLLCLKLVAIQLLIIMQNWIHGIHMCKCLNVNLMQVRRCLESD